MACMKLLILLQLWISIISAHSTITVETYAPIPTSKVDTSPQFVKDGYRTQSFGNGAYMVTDSDYQCLFFVACESVVVVDAPPSIGHNILHAIRNVTSLPISHVVYSHSHADHIGAAYLLGSPENITLLGHIDTANALSLVADSRRPAPTIKFESSYELSVCNQTLHLDYRVGGLVSTPRPTILILADRFSSAKVVLWWMHPSLTPQIIDGPNHEPGNIFIYAPLQKVLMLVDVIYPGWIPFELLAESSNIPGWIKAHQQILTYDFEHYVGGHLDFTGTRHDVLIQQEYVEDLFNISKNAILRSGKGSQKGENPISIDVIGPSVEKVNPNNFWAEVATYDGILAEYVGNASIAKWGHVLAGCDVYAVSNAQAMLESLRLDWGILGPFGVAAE